MNKQDQDKLDQHRQKVMSELLDPEFFDSFTLETLNNFAYRYFDQATVSKKVWQQPHRYEVAAREVGIKEAIKISNTGLRESLKQLVLNFPPSKVTLERRFFVEFEDTQAGTVKVGAALSFGHPLHDYSAKTFIEKTQSLEFSEFLVLRNRLAGLLEAVAELYG